MDDFEIDFTSNLSPKIKFEGAMVLDGETIAFGQTLADFEIMEEGKMGLQAGLMDIPFGLDYNFFANPDRRFVSVPLITENMMDGGWSDVKVVFHGILPPFDYHLYLVNGMGADEKNLRVNQVSDNNGRQTVGERFLTSLLQEEINLGFSYAQGAWLPGHSENMLKKIGISTLRVGRKFRRFRFLSAGCEFLVLRRFYVCCCIKEIETRSKGQDSQNFSRTS